MTRPGPPALPRYRVEVILTVELSAASETDAHERLGALLARTDVALHRTVRGPRLSSAELVDVEVEPHRTKLAPTP